MTNSLIGSAPPVREKRKAAVWGFLELTYRANGFSEVSGRLREVGQCHLSSNSAFDPFGPASQRGPAVERWVAAVESGRVMAQGGDDDR
jgi:hypothetical protein